MDPSSSTANAVSSSSSTSAVKMPTKKAVYNPLIQGTKRKSRKDEDWEREDMNDGTDSGIDVNWKASGRDKAADDRSYVTGALDWDADAKEDEEKRKRKKMIDVSQAREQQTDWTDRAHADLPHYIPDAPSTCLTLQDALNDGVPDDGMYHGAAAYKSHLEQREDGGSNKFKAGPVKASSNIRTITVIDYQPDVCKDYKGQSRYLCTIVCCDTDFVPCLPSSETGWCGFGDTCKFLHDVSTCVSYVF
jgi:RING finger protein 113A